MSVQLHISSWTWVSVGVYECATSHFILDVGGGGGVQVCKLILGMGGGGGATSHFILGVGGGGGV